MHLVRVRLQGVVPGLPLAGGTNQFFAELNRDRPDCAAMDEVVYSLNPQVHACDDTSLVENLEAQAETVRMARSLCADRPIIISPVTLIGRLGPYAAGPPQPGELPPNVDVRQASLFGAGWTAGSIKYLSESGAASLTYYETTGWLGLVETEAGSPMPDRFPSIPGAVFPLYHVFADLAALQGGELVEAHSSDPLTVEALALRSAGRTHLLVANMTHAPQTVVVTPLPPGRVRMRRLDEESALDAMTDPARFRSSGSTEEVRNRELELTLAPYAVVRIDALEPLP
jgi:hypothetical protein